MTNLFDDSLTLDPPGSIAIIGAGAIGIEAALYGRFLGYEVTVFESNGIGSSMAAGHEDPLPMMPDRCVTPMAISALKAQTADDDTVSLPLTTGQWIEVLERLAETDLLRGRLISPATVTRIDPVAIQPDTEDEDVSDLPPDFRVTYSDADGKECKAEFESVIIATGGSNDIQIGFSPPTEYLFEIHETDAKANAEIALWRGFHTIVQIYAQLAGRSELDLYCPRGG